MAGGFFPPPPSNIRAAGGSAGGENNPVSILQSIDRSLKTLVERLAPAAYRQRFTITNLSAGLSTNPANINAPSNNFNSINVNLTSGIVNIYIGGTFIYQVQAQINPFTIFLPTLPISGTIVFTCDAASPVAANGFIDIQQL